MKSLLTILIAFGLAGSVCAQPHPGDVKNFYSGELMKNACSKSELNRLKTDVVSLASKRSPEIVWRLTSHMLCGVSTSSKSLVLSNTERYISYEDNTETSDGTTKKTKRHRNKLKFVKGHAYEASAVAVDGAVRILFDQGGVCTGSFDMRYIAERWKIVGTAVYCD